MRNFVALVSIVFVTTFFLFGCAPLTKEQQAEREFHSIVISVLERESDAGRIEMHRVITKNSKTWSASIVIEAIKKGYVSKGPEIKGYRGEKYLLNEGSVPAIVKKFKIYPMIVKKVDFRITNNPSPGKIAFYESTTVEFEFKGELNEFGKFLKKRGAKVLSEGIGMCTMVKKDDGWHIGAY